MPKDWNGWRNTVLAVILTAFFGLVGVLLGADRGVIVEDLKDTKVKVTEIVKVNASQDLKIKVNEKDVEAVKEDIEEIKEGIKLILKKLEKD